MFNYTKATLTEKAKEHNFVRESAKNIL